MPSVALTTLGCKVNQYETQRILESFEGAGFRVVPFDTPADIYVINTCSVTSSAESKSRFTVRKAKRTNPLAKVVVTGCAGQMALNRKEEFPGADVLVPHEHKLQALDHALVQISGLREWLSIDPSFDQEAKPAGRTRATLKIQDGCNVMCSYCSIPYTRPGMASRPWQEVLKEAKQLAESGFQEAILTGVLIGAYGPESGSEGPGFEDLVSLLARESGLARLRISSIEMHQVTEPILDLARQGVVVPHFHIPLQSGDSQVLKDMNRRYDQSDFLCLCKRVKDSVPGVTLTTDIMVGFPTETPERFESSVRVCEEVSFLKAHVFRFSPRFGTPADQWGDPVTPPQKQERALRLAQLTEQTGRQETRRFVGETLRVLIEGKIGKDGLLEGTSDNWLTVKATGSPSLTRTLQWIRIDEERDGIAHGEIVPRPTRLGLRMAR